MNVILKQLSNKKVHFSIATIYASYFGLPVSFIISLIMLITGTTQRDQELLKDIPSFTLQIFFSLMSGVSGVLSQIAKVTSYKHEDASKISIIRSTDLFFTYIFQYFFLNISTNIYSGIGALLIIFGTVLILVYKMVETNITKSNDKKSNLLKRIFIYKF